MREWAPAKAPRRGARPEGDFRSTTHGKPSDTCGMKSQSLALKDRPVDLFLAIVFLMFAVTSAIADAIPTLGIRMASDAPSFLGRANYWYASGCDPLFLNPPTWMRMVTGLSAFVYGPFYLVLAYALVRGRNWIQLPAVIYATMIASITGIVVFGVEFFGEPEWRCQNVPKFLACNLPYVLVPLLLLVRMRAPRPFDRRF
jgi:hypothetical protein